MREYFWFLVPLFSRTKDGLNRFLEVRKFVRHCLKPTEGECLPLSRLRKWKVFLGEGGTRRLAGGASDLEDLSLWGQSSLPGDQPLSPKGWPLPTLPTPLPVPGEGHIPESLNPHKERKWI